MQSVHIVSAYDEELKFLAKRLAAMGGHAERMVEQSVAALVNADTGLAQKVIRDDAVLDEAQREIDDKAILIIARRQPTASDLRMVMMVVTTITDLERIGDKAGKIARLSKRIYGSGLSRPRFREIEMMSELVLEMLRKALDSFARLDPALAVDVSRADEKVDEEFRSVFRQLITFMMEDPRTISRSLDVMFMAKAIERIGDHAKNIAEYVIYMGKGLNVPHTTPDQLDDELAKQ